MKCPINPEHELTKPANREYYECCKRNFKPCSEGKSCKSIGLLQQVAEAAGKQIPVIDGMPVPLMLYARKGGQDEDVRVYGEETRVLRIGYGKGKCIECSKGKKRAASASPTREVQAEGEADFRGGGEPCLGHIAKATPCTERPDGDGLCAECAKEFKKEVAAGVGYLRDALISVTIASGGTARLTWMDKYRGVFADTDGKDLVDRDPVGRLEKKGYFQRDDHVLAIFGVEDVQVYIAGGTRIKGAARMAAIKERFLAIQALFDDERVRNPRFVSSKLQQWIEGASEGDKPKTATLMPAFWWGLHKTNFAPLLRPSKPKIGTPGMDLTTLLRRENDHLWPDTDQHPMLHLLRDGSMVPDKVPDGENHKKYDDKRCSASGKIFLQPVSKFLISTDGAPLTYGNLVEDMHEVFSDTSRFIFQDQCVPFLDVRVEYYFKHPGKDDTHFVRKYMINLYTSVKETNVYERVDVPEEHRMALGYYWHDGVRPVQGRDRSKKGKLLLKPGKPGPPPGHY